MILDQYMYYLKHEHECFYHILNFLNYNVSVQHKCFKWLQTEEQ